MGSSRSRSIALDAGALIALESKRGRALLYEWERSAHLLVISAGALAQAIRRPERQALLSHLLRHRRTKVCDLDRSAALACGKLLAVRGSSDVVEAHVVISAREHHVTTVVTGDPDDLRRLDPAMHLTTI